MCQKLPYFSNTSLFSPLDHVIYDESILITHQRNQHPHVNFFGFIDKNFFSDLPDLCGIGDGLAPCLGLLKLSEEMFIFSLLIHIISIQLFILFQHSFVSLIESFLFFRLDLDSLGFCGNNWDFIDYVVRNKGTSDTLSERLLEGNCLDLLGIAVNGEMTGLGGCVIAIDNEA